MKVENNVRRTRDCVAMSTLMDGDKWSLLVARRPQSLFCAVREGLRNGQGITKSVILRQYQKKSWRTLNEKVDSYKQDPKEEWVFPYTLGVSMNEARMYNYELSRKVSRLTVALCIVSMIAWFVASVAASLPRELISLLSTFVMVLFAVGLHVSDRKIKKTKFFFDRSVISVLSTFQVNASVMKSSWSHVFLDSSHLCDALVVYSKRSNDTSYAAIQLFMESSPDAFDRTCHHLLDAAAIQKMTCDNSKNYYQAFSGSVEQKEYRPHCSFEFSRDERELPFTHIQSNMVRFSLYRMMVAHAAESLSH